MLWHVLRITPAYDVECMPRAPLISQLVGASHCQAHISCAVDQHHSERCLSAQVNIPPNHPRTHGHLPMAACYVPSQNNTCLTLVPLLLVAAMICGFRCVLHNKSEAELFKLGECPLDPGGYFIVRVSERMSQQVSEADT